MELISIGLISVWLIPMEQISVEQIYAVLISVEQTSVEQIYGADLRGANLCGAENVPFIPMVCPESGSYTAFKKVSGDFIVVLEIPEDAFRSSSTTRKCRASKAVVKSIENLDGSNAEGVTEVFSKFDNNFKYRIGETVEVENFDMNRWHECSSGIHHFMNRQEAVDYIG